VTQTDTDGSVRVQYVLGRHTRGQPNAATQY